MLRPPRNVRKLLGIAGERLGLWLLFEPRDLWVGAYWNLDPTHGVLYLCILPTLPIRLSWVRRPQRRI